jgi:S-(hydroxymethyl)glutathione dehydrogenase / alcohol dehydrogenase
MSLRRALLLTAVRAAVAHRFKEPLVVEDVDLQRPGGGEVRVKVEAVGICHSDITFMDGLWGGDLPAVFGHEVAGIVDEVGAGVEMKTGAHVTVTLVRSCGTCFYCARGVPTQCEGTFAIDQRHPLTLAGGVPVKQGLRVGGFAEFVTVHASQVVPIDESVPFDSACLLSCAVATGVGAVRNTAHVQAGDSVAVVGAGGVGLNSIQGAAIAGARSVIAIDVSDSRLASARTFGATDVINSTKVNPRDAVRGMTEGRGADVTLIASGSPAAIQVGLGLSRRAGTVVIVGITASGETVPIDMGEVADAALRVLGTKMGSIRPQVDIPEMVELYKSGRLKLDELVTARYPLEEINQALEVARSGAGIRTVVVP